MNAMDIVNLDAYIPQLKAGDRIEPIRRGYSSDGKSIVYRQEAPHCVLRTYLIDQHESKCREFDVLALMEKEGVVCSRPIANGTISELGIGYMLVSYVEGADAADELPRLPADVQYRIGVQAGVELKRIHRVKGPDHMRPWSERITEKYRRYAEAYRSCGTRMDNDDRVLAFIDSNLELTHDRPTSFQHDDFHTGNLIVRGEELSGVIDFNRYDWGDPIHDFLKAGFFSAPVSIPFSIGQIKGYHDGADPDGHFWRLYSLYLAMNLIGSVVWILKVKPEETGGMLDRIHGVLEDHRWFESPVPAWYSFHSQ